MKAKWPRIERKGTGCAAMVVVLGAAATGWILQHSRSSQPPPTAIAAQLSAHDAIGFIAVESPDTWLANLDRGAQDLSPEERLVLAPFLSPESRKAALGFDPTDAESWRAIGVAPERGLALTFDAQHLAGTLPTPFLWTAPGAPRTPQLAGLKWAANEHWASAALPIAGQPTPTTWTEAASPRLDRDPVLQAAFTDMPTEKCTALYLHADGLLAALRLHLKGEKLAALQYLTQRVRGLSLVLSPSGTGGRVVLSSDGVE